MLFKKLLDRINSDFNRNLFKVLKGTAIGQVSMIIATPLLTRIYNPEAFGGLAVYSSIIGVFAIILSLRLDLAILKVSEKKEAVNLVISTTFIVLVTSGLAIGIVSKFRSFFVSTDISDITLFLTLLFIALFGNGLYPIFNAWNMREKKYRILSASRSQQGLFTGGFQLVLGYAGITSWLGLIIGNLVGLCIGIYNLAREFVRLQKLKWPKRRVVDRMFRIHKRFVLVSTPGSLVNNLGLHLPLILMTKFYGLELVGYYALADKIIRIPFSLLGKSTQSVFLSEFTGLNSEARELLFVRTSKKLGVVVIVPVILVFCFSDFVFKTVFGPEWLYTASIIRILSPLIVVRFIVSPFIHVLSLTNNQGALLLWETSRLLLISLVFYLGNYLFLGFQELLIFYMLVSSGTYIFLYVLIRYTLTRSINYG